MSGPGAAALGASPAWTVDTAKLRKGKSTVAPSSVSSFLFSPVRPRFPAPERVDSFPSCQRPTSTFPLLSSLLPFHPINNVVPPSPTLPPFLPSTVSISFPLCVCVLVDCQFLDCLVNVIVFADHLVIDKRMRSGEAGKLNSPLRIDSTIPTTTTDCLFQYCYISFAITSFSFISFFFFTPLLCA